MTQIGDLLLTRARAWAELKMADRMLRASYDLGEGSAAERSVIEQTLKIENQPVAETPPVIHSVAPDPPIAALVHKQADLALEPAPPAHKPVAPVRIEPPPAPKKLPKGAVWTEERKALVRRDYPTGRDSRDIVIDLRALPGAPYYPGSMADAVRRLGIFAHYVGVKRPPKRAANGSAGALGAEAPSAAPQTERVLGVGTTATPAEPTTAIAEALGRPAPRAPAAKPGPKPFVPSNPRTDARIALVDDLYPKRVPVTDIVARCNSLPGPPVRGLDIMAWATARGLKHAEA